MYVYVSITLYVLSVVYAEILVIYPNVFFIVVEIVSIPLDIDLTIILLIVYIVILITFSFESFIIVVTTSDLLSRVITVNPPPKF